jgi:hypothetical protein
MVPKEVTCARPDQICLWAGADPGEKRARQGVIRADEKLAAVLRAPDQSGRPFLFA